MTNSCNPISSSRHEDMLRFGQNRQTSRLSLHQGVDGVGTTSILPRNLQRSDTRVKGPRTNLSILRSPNDRNLLKGVRWDLSPIQLLMDIGYLCSCRVRRSFCFCWDVLLVGSIDYNYVTHIIIHCCRLVGYIR